MSHYTVQERPNHPGEDGGDALVTKDGGEPFRVKSWYEAWADFGGTTQPGDTVTVLHPDLSTPEEKR